MFLKDQISENIKVAMKNGEPLKLSVLRGINASINNKLIEKRSKDGTNTELTDKDILEVIMSEAKKRKEAKEAFEKGGREDLAKNEATELEILQTYLPKQLSEEETKQKIEKILNSSQANDFGSAMKIVMAELRGTADAKIITQIVKGRFE